MRLPVRFLAALCLALTAGCGGGGDSGGPSGPPEPIDPSFLHAASPGTLDGAGTILSHPLLDEDPSASMLVTHVLNPGGALVTVPNAHPIGVRYMYLLGRWEIFNLDDAAMEAGAAFNVLVLEGPRHLLHTAIPENTAFNHTIVSHAAINGDPDRLLFVTQYAGAPDAPGYFPNPHHIGVYYFSSTWRVFNQDGDDMTLGANFFVAFEGPRSRIVTHVADAASIGGPSDRRMYVSNTALDGVPDARIQVTANWNPSGAPGVYNDHPIGVYYDSARGPSGQWAIENVDGAEMPLGASFNIWVE
jgi:hypothetical protein